VPETGLEGDLHLDRRRLSPDVLREVSRDAWTTFHNAIREGLADTVVSPGEGSPRPSAEVFRSPAEGPGQGVLRGSRGTSG
jgi:hypothetical protein